VGGSFVLLPLKLCDDFRTWLAMIHRFGNSDDLDQARAGEMRVHLCELQTLREFKEVVLLCGTQRMQLEERHDDLLKFSTLADTEPVDVLFVVVIAPVDVYGADTEVIREHVKASDTLCALSHRKLMSELESRSVSLAAHSIRLSDEIDRETTLPIDETRDPADIEQTVV
jgi:hypothetical protein